MGHSKQLKSLGEFGLINWIKQSCGTSPSVKKGIGDDTAILPYSSKEDLLMTTDMFIEDVHFTSKTKPELVGRKALACNISDVAAMGGIPTFAVVSLALPSRTKTDYVKKIYQGMNQLAKEFGVNIFGGDTSKSDKIVLDVTLLGKVEKGKAVLRNGAKPGDHIFVSGPLGGSLKSGRHLSFTPRVKEARYLLEKFKPTAMIDISDGLAGDLGHILEESGVGAIIDEQKIPLNSKSDLKAGLYDGEDFELLFTLSKSQANKFAKLKKKTFSFFGIGEIIATKKKLVLMNKQGKKVLLPLKGFTHF